MGAWISVMLSTVNRTELGAKERRYSLLLRYGIEILDIPEHCDGCGTAFDIYHTLNFKKGSLVTACQNKLRNGVADYVIKAFTPTHVYDDPKIYTVCAIRGGKNDIKWSPSKYVEELKGGILIREPWIQGTDSIHNMRVANSDATSYQSKSPENCLETDERENKKKYIYACLKHNCYLTPFVVSVEILLGVEAEETLRCNAMPSTSQLGGRNPTHIPAGTRRVGLQSLLSGWRTAASGAPVLQPLISACNTPSGWMARI